MPKYRVLTPIFSLVYFTVEAKSPAEAVATVEEKALELPWEPGSDPWPQCRENVLEPVIVEQANEGGHAEEVWFRKESVVLWSGRLNNGGEDA